jgi:hypothetical protein
MEYYYTDSANEVRGPVSEEVLKNLFFQCRITLDSNVLLVGTPDWRCLRDYFPDLEFYRGCPKCYQKATVEDRSCPHCQFSIADFDANLVESCRRPIQQNQTNKVAVDALIRGDLKAFNTGCYFSLMVLFAVFLCFIPVFGVYMGALLFMFGLVAFLSPPGLKFWLLRTFREEKLTELREKANEELTSPFVGPCPKCNQYISRVMGVSPVSIICPHCISHLHLRESFIYFVPHPAAAPNDDFAALFPV